jgi:hypothetical protein
MVGIGFNFVSIDNDLVLSATLEIRRLRATIDVQTVDALLMEANEGCYAVPGVILADLLDTDHPSVTFEFSFYRRKRTPTTTSSTTPPARAPSETKKRKRPMKRSAQDSDSDTQYQSQRRRRREGSVIGASLSLFNSRWLLERSGIVLQI